jgi:hypothetical protein
VKQQAWAIRTIAAALNATGEHSAADDEYAKAIALAESIQLYPDVSEYAAEFAQKLRERNEYEKAFHYLEVARRHAHAADGAGHRIAPAPDR